MAALNYKALGLRCGLEIHQELETNRKLFCFCPPELQTTAPDLYIKRYFRPVLGEMGKFDEAMLVEYKKQLTIIYEVFNNVCCTYELDETPPFEIDKKALEIGLIMGHLLNLNLYNELYVCRKNYLDGSVPCGFQRTLLIGSDGCLMVNEKEIGITTIAIEEDAARKITEEGKIITYRLDRLGIPLIEIVTDPDINTPEECMLVAHRLGLLLRSTGLMKRGLGTIRQDVNVSIEGGARVEIKGVQKLDWIPPLIENEVRRQLNLIKIRNELRVRELTVEDLNQEFIDVTTVFKKATWNIVKEALKTGQKVLAVKVPKCTGILGSGFIEGYRFGKEIAQKVSAITGLRGIIHSDEDLTSYEFKKTEVNALKKALNVEEKDAFIMLVADEERGESALKVAVNRIARALQGVPNETRKALEDYSTEFIRELHGGARLYPDTDSSPIHIAKDYLKELSKNLPELPWHIAERLRENYELDDITIDNLILQGYASLFEEIVKKFKVNPILVSTTLLGTLKSIQREGFESDNITDQHIRGLFELINKQEIAKEAIDDLLKELARNPKLTAKEAKNQLEIKAVSMKEVEKIINDILKENENLIKEETAERAHKKLMGPVMKELRGKMDGKLISEKLRELVENYSPEASADKIIGELISANDNLIKERGMAAYDILIVKLKRRLKDQIKEEILEDKLKRAIEKFLKGA